MSLQTLNHYNAPQDDSGQHHDQHPGHVAATHFTVDGEPYETRALALTADEILREFAGQDSATHYLVQIQGRERTSFEGKGNEPIHMKNGMRFQVISTGPTPVSYR